MALQGIIFDCDGLLIDTETPEFVSWQEVFQSHGATLLLEVWQAGIGTAFSFDIYDMLEEQCGKAVDKAAIRAVRRPRHDQMVLEGGLLPGVLSTIQTARQMNLKLAVASSSSAAWVHWCLESFQLTPYFDVVVTADDVDVVKPDPLLYLLALERMGCATSAAIALEDSPNGVLAAVRAGLFCIAVPNPMTASLDFSHASRRLKTLEDLDLAALCAQFSQ